jgi:hypothetical protein
MMSLRLLVPLFETRLLCFVCSDAFIGASLFEEVTQKIAPLVVELASPERILNFVDRQMSISVLKFPPHIAATENGSLCERMRSSRVARA